MSAPEKQVVAAAGSSSTKPRAVHPTIKPAWLINPTPTQMFLFSVSIFFFMIIACFPIWDYVDEFVLIKESNRFVAPILNSPDISYNWAPRIPVKRFVIAAIVGLELLFAGNFIAVFSRGRCKKALRVWLYYNRVKFILAICAAGIVFCGLWYFFFFDWTFWAELDAAEKAFLGYAPVKSMVGMLSLFAALFLAWATAFLGFAAGVLTLASWRAWRKIRRVHEGA